MSYWRFAAMIATSTVVMYGLMYLNTYALEHVFWSQTRAWMALLMGAAMAMIMLGYMLGMYRSRAVNLAIFGGAAAVFALSLWLVRSQVTVADADYMKAMIPHHSIAIMTSERAGIRDARVRRLADEILEAQEREIAEMKYLIGAADLAERAAGPADPAPPADIPPAQILPAQILPAEEAIAGAQVARLDPAPMQEAEIREALGDGPRCTFRYTSSGTPVLAARMVAAAAHEGVVKLNGNLIRAGASPADDGLLLEAGRIRLTLTPLAGAAADGGGEMQTEADLTVEVGDERRVGYRGYYRCERERARMG